MPANDTTARLNELQGRVAEADAAYGEATAEVRNEYRAASELYSWAVAELAAGPLDEHRVRRYEEATARHDAAREAFTKATTAAKGARTKRLKVIEDELGPAPAATAR